MRGGGALRYDELNIFLFCGIKQEKDIPLLENVNTKS